jgi:DNA-3-methyladenine glycosylase
MQARRSVTNTVQLTNGPGKLCAAMDITRAQNGADLCDNKSPLFIAENPSRQSFLRKHGPIVTTTRVGITKAAALPLRFFLQKNPYVSQRIRSNKT